MPLEKKEFFIEEFSKTMKLGDNQFLSFYKNLPIMEEFEKLFFKATQNFGTKHFGIYRMCDAEYMYCVGRRVPSKLSLAKKIRYSVKTGLINAGIIKQKTGHENPVNKEFWFGESYSLSEKKHQKDKFLSDLKEVSAQGFLSPYLIYSKAQFAEEYFKPVLRYFDENDIKLTPENYFPFYFVYVMLSLDKFKNILYKGRNVLIVTAFNERNKQDNFKNNLGKEGVANLYFYNISHDKAMLEKIDRSKLPEKVDLVLIGAGIGSVNIINQLSHLNALCIDAGHALDCISRPELRIERMCLLPDSQIS